MRDVVAAVFALVLLLAAIALGGALHLYRRQRRQARVAAESEGRIVIAELPLGADLTLVSEDRQRLYYGDKPIEKARIDAARLLINGAPIATCERPGRAGPFDVPPVPIRSAEDGIPRDRWDVAVYTGDGVVLIECGAIRERVSQELARNIFDAVKRSIGEEL
jgi:hypothetical protein